MALGSLARRPTVLIVLHQEHSTPGRIGLALKAMGVRLTFAGRVAGEPLPGTLADHNGVVAFGGPMGANDTLDWVRREIEWLEPRSPRTNRCWASALARKCWPARSARGYSVTTTSAARSATTRSSPHLRANGCARPSSHARSTNGIRRDSIFPKVPSSSQLAGEFPQPGLSLWSARCWPAVPSGSHLSHDVPLDPSRCRAPDSARGAEPARASRRLVPA